MLTDFAQEFELSGEKFLVERLATTEEITIFDVGCNRGEWTRMARKNFPLAHIHCFEVVPVVFRSFLDNHVLDARVYPNSFGLFDKFALVDIKFMPEIDTLGTMLPNISPGTFNAPFEVVSGLVVTGDAYKQSRNIGNIDLLKIDVEGVEHNVLNGFREALANNEISVIQIEYGLANIVSKYLLMDYYLLLMDKFVIGKLTNEGVKFKNYNYYDEDFRGNNIVAVNRNRPDLIAKLA